MCSLRLGSNYSKVKLNMQYLFPMSSFPTRSDLEDKVIVLHYILLNIWLIPIYLVLLNVLPDLWKSNRVADNWKENSCEVSQLSVRRRYGI
jgi:hypothetical protein